MNPTMPNISAGGGGPSWAAGQSSGTGGMSNAGWTLNFGGSSSDGPAIPRSVGYQFGMYGLPQLSALAAGSAGFGGQAGSVSPVVLLGGLLLLALVLRRRA